jgi:hypothetical protein
MTQPALTLRFLATGTMEDEFVKAYAMTATPLVYGSVWGNLFRSDITVAPDGFNRWLVTVPYGQNVAPTASWSWSYDSTGGSFHIKASKATVAKYPAGAPDFKQLIGVHGDDVDGADIVIPSMKITVNYKHPLGFLTLDYAYTIGSLTGYVNSATMLRRPAGEVLFLGGTGSDGTTAEVEATYQFAVSKNLQNAVVGAITGIQKDGWDVAWIKWKDASDGGKPVKQPESIYVERVYDRINLAAALGFGG